MYDDNFYTLLEAEGILPVWLTTGTGFVMCNFKNNFILFYFCFVKAPPRYSSCLFYKEPALIDLCHSHLDLKMTHFLLNLFIDNTFQLQLMHVPPSAHCRGPCFLSRVSRCQNVGVLTALSETMSPRLGGTMAQLN